MFVQPVFTVSALLLECVARPLTVMSGTPTTSSVTPMLKRRFYPDRGKVSLFAIVLTTLSRFRYVISPIETRDTNLLAPRGFSRQNYI